MDAHRIDVLDGADDHDVVGVVAHDLELVLFPPEDGPLDQDLGHRARGEAGRGDGCHLVAVPRDPGAPAAEDERRSDDDRVADALRDRECFVDRIGEPGPKNREADLLHRGLEARAILGGVDRLATRADQLDVEALEHTRVIQRDREVQCGLAAERRQQRVGALTLDDPSQGVDVEWLDIGRVGELRVGHDRRRVRVHQHDAVSFATQHAACLRTRVVELTRLADHDRPAADDQNRAEVVAARHGYPAPAMRSVKAPNKYAASCGPGPASGWCCTLNARAAGTRRPSTVPSLRFTCVISAPSGTVSACTT